MKTNNIIVKENCAEIILKYKDEDFVVLVDLDDLDKIKQVYWRITPSSHNLYVSGWERGLSKKNRRFLRLHRFITNCPKDKVIDHINHNTLDNRKQNLRVCTQSENGKNRILSSQNKTGYRNIYFDSKTGTYRCEIKENGKIVFKKSRVKLDEMLQLRDEFILSRYGSMENMLVSKTKS